MFQALTHVALHMRRSWSLVNVKERKVIFYDQEFRMEQELEKKMGI